MTWIDLKGSITKGDKMGIFGGLKDFLLSVMLKKGLKKVVQVGIAFLTSSGVIAYLGANGISVDVDPVMLNGALTTLITGLLEMLRNFLKNKVGLKWL